MIEEKNVPISHNKLEVLDERVELSILFDFYGELLKEQKKQIFEDYIQNDLSLSEIAEDKGITRQGVHDIVKRCSIELREYEEKLNLCKKFQSIRDELNQICQISETIKTTKHIDQLDEIEQLANDILKEL